MNVAPDLPLGKCDLIEADMHVGGRPPRGAPLPPLAEEPEKPLRWHLTTFSKHWNGAEKEYIISVSG